MANRMVDNGEVDITGAMALLGYELNSYYSYINTSHPCYLAMIGILPLTPEIWMSMPREILRLDMPPPTDYDHERRALVFYDMTRKVPKSSTCSYWTISKLKQEILRLPTFPGECEICKSDSNKTNPTPLSLLTGKERDVCIPLPGFGISFYHQEHYMWNHIDRAWYPDYYKEEYPNMESSDDMNVLSRWRTLYMRKSYFTLVYNTLVEKRKRLRCSGDSDPNRPDGPHHPI